MQPPIYEDVAPEQWRDGNGHMNITYYTLLVTRFLDGLVDWAGLGTPYRDQRGAALFITESRYRYRRELIAGDAVLVRGRFVQAEAKTLDAACDITCPQDGSVAASFTGRFVNVNLRTRRSQPFEAPILAHLHTLIEAGEMR